MNYDPPSINTDSEKARRILETCKEEGVRFLRLQFTDVMGVNKNVEVPESQFEKALEGKILFDGSSIEGFSRIEESDMLLVPDLDTFRIFPWEDEAGLAGGAVARLICDIHNPDGSPFAGCPRLCLKRAVAKAAELGYEMLAGPEAEFFLFHLDPEGEPTTRTHDQAGYFDLAPVDEAEPARREMVSVLTHLGFEIEASHHEVAPGQHEIDFKYGSALETADNLVTFKFVVRKVARDFGLHATFMPKPIFGINGSGMHTHQSLRRLSDGQNAFFDPDDKEQQLSQVARNYIAGVLAHARGFCAVTNPTVNSFKRLVPGFEAPTHLAWSERNRSPLIRVPARRGEGTRIELRMPDPSSNPYLALAVQLAAGIDGIEKKMPPPPPVEGNVYHMTAEEREKLGIKSLPGNLNEALDCLEQDEVVCAALGEHLKTYFVRAKRAEWQEYIAQVHGWEVRRYLSII